MIIRYKAEAGSRLGKSKPDYIIQYFESAVINLIYLALLAAATSPAHKPQEIIC